MSGKDLSKTVPTVPNKHAKGKRWSLPDVIKLYQLRVERGLSFGEIGQMYGVTKQAVYKKLNRLFEHLPNQENIQAFKDNKPTIMDGVTMTLLAQAVDPERLKKGTVNQFMYGAEIADRIKRLEEGKSTVNIGLKTMLIDAASRHNDKPIDVSPKRSRDDKPRQEGQKKS